MFGGAEHSVLLLASNLKKSHECAVFTADSFCGKLICENVDGVTVFRSGSHVFNLQSRFKKNENKIQKLFNRISDFFNPIATRQFRQVLDQFKPDVIHTNGLRGISPVIWKIAHERGVKVVHSLRDYFSLDPLMRETPPESLVLNYWREYWNKYSRFIDVVSAPSAFTLEKTVSRGFSSEHSVKKAVPNSISFELQYFQEAIQEAINRLNCETRFIFVGTLVEFKGILLLIEAFEILLSKRSDIELVVCGTGPLVNFVEEASKKYPAIQYRGQLKSTDLAVEYRNADVCVIPSIWEEPFGRVVIEAAYNGCALITSNMGGIPEIVKTLDSGEVWSDKNVNTLAKLMDFLCEKKNRLKQLEKIKEHIEDFSVQKQIESFEKIYGDICAK